MKKLPENVRSLINATIQLNNHAKAVEELVYNSLDAGATSIAIRVNIEENIIQVIDNGCGVTKKDLKCVGKNYMTSKFTDLSTLNSAPNKYGFRGQFLANLINISKNVTVISRHESCEETWKKIFENGKEKLLEKCDMRPSKGTTVEVKGFLYNISIKKIVGWHDLHSIKIFLENLSLMHSNISLSLRDDLRNEIIFKMHKSRDIYQTLSTLYNIEKDDIEEFKVEKNEYKVRGILGKSDKECGRNDIFLNGKYISDSSKLHKTVKCYIKKHLHLQDKKIIKVKKNNEDNCVIQNNIPFYFIFITCPYFDYNLSSSPQQSVLEFKDWNQINKLLEKLIKFSAGNVNLKECNVINDDKNKTTCNKSDTREEVKKIIEKILGQHSKNTIPHVLKGIKGKQIKRKTKEPPLNKLITKEIKHKNKLRLLEDDENEHYNINSPADISLGKDIHKKAKNCDKLNKTKQANQLNAKTPENRTAKNLNSFGKVFNSKFKKISKGKEFVAKELVPKNNRLGNKTVSKKQILMNSLIRKFEMNTYSVQKRCSELSQQVKKALRKRNKKKTEVHYTESVQFSNLNESNRNVTVRKKINEIVIHRHLPKSNFNNKPYVDQKKSHEKIFQSNYDLLETILRTQEENKEQKLISRNPLPISIDCSTQQDGHKGVYKPFDLETSTNFIQPFLTFDSHDYFARKNYSTSDQNSLQMGVTDSKLMETGELNHNLEREEEATIDLLQISLPDTDSRNFTKNTTKNKESKDIRSTTGQSGKCTKNNLKKKYSKQISSNIKNVFKQTSKPFHFNHFVSTTEKSYTIDFTDSDKIINVSDDMNMINKTGTNSIKNTYSLNIEEIWTQSAKNNKNEVLKDDQVMINTTYTLSKSTHQGSRNDDECHKLKTYTIEQDATENSTRYGNISSNTENYIFIYKSQEPKQIDNLDPITVCETVLQSQEVKDKESVPNIGKPYSNIYNCNNNSDKNSNNDNLNGEENEEFTDTSLNCGQKKENRNCEELPEQFSSSKTEPLRNVDVLTRLEDQTQSKTAEIENNNNMVIGEDEYNKDVIENAENCDGFNLRNRPCFLPKGMSPIFENCNIKHMGDCILSKEYFEDEMYQNFIDNVQNNVEVFEPKIQEPRDATTKAIDKVNAKLNKDSASLKFDGMSLKDAKVLGQVDDKFIAAVIKGGSSKGEVSDFIVLFDQHAVHERIRLENNLSEYLVDNQWVSIDIDEVTLKISKYEALFLHNYKEKFMQLGLQWTLLTHDEITFGGIPAAILGKNVREVDKVIKAVKSLITEEINIIRMQNGCISLYPKSIMDLVFSEACRYAIKFGEKLSRSRCAELLKMLSECKTPFQCAHGRPAMAVIMEIKHDNPGYFVNLQKVKEWKSKIAVQT